MPFTPDQPFPKDIGHTVRSKDWNDLVREVQRLDTAKVSNTSDTMKGSLSVETTLTVKGASTFSSLSASGDATIGGTANSARLKIFRNSEDANGTALVVEATGNASANLRLGVHNDYSWIQGNKPLFINPLGNNVRIGSNPIQLSSGWSDAPASGNNVAEISNDTGNYKTLMIVGNRAASNTVRSVSVWDKLTVNGTQEIKSSAVASASLYIEPNSTANNPESSGIYVYNRNSAAGTNARLTLRVEGNNAGNAFVSFDTAGVFGYTLGMHNSDNLFHIAREWQFERNLSDFTLDRNGRIGIGTATPSRRLHVHSDSADNSSEIHASGKMAGFSFMSRDTGLEWDQNKPGQRWVLYSDGLTARLWTPINGDIMTIDSDGNMTLKGRLGNKGFSHQPHTAGWGGGIRTWDLEVEASAWVKGGVQTGARDVAETYPAAIALEAGDVVCLHPVDDQLVLCDRTNDTAVFGVISSQPGLLLGMNALNDLPAGQYPVALSGQVTCKVVAENGAIQRGDLLTTSSVPGHAMRALPMIIDGQEFYRPGTIIGKALSGLDAEIGTIEMLVTLM